MITIDVKEIDNIPNIVMTEARFREIIAMAFDDGKKYGWPGGRIKFRGGYDYINKSFKVTKSNATP